MSVQSGQTVTIGFTTRDPSTSVRVNADSLPTGILAVNGTNDVAVVTVTNVTTGRYKASVALPSLAIGDFVEIIAVATVNSATDQAVVFRDTKDIVLPPGGDPLAAAVPSTYDAGTAGYVLGHLDPTDVTVQLPVDPSGNIVLRIGDDYLSAAGTQLPFSSAGLWPDLTGATIAFELWQPSQTTVMFSFPGVVTTPTGDQVVYIPLTKTQIGTITPGQFAYRVQATLATMATLGLVVTLSFGICLVTRP